MLTLTVHQSKTYECESENIQHVCEGGSFSCTHFDQSEPKKCAASQVRSNAHQAESQTEYFSKHVDLKNT